MSVAKPLANGLPIGVCMLGSSLASSTASTSFLGTHGSTFAGNPIVCAAASAVLEEVLEDGFLEEVTRKGEWFVERLEGMARKYPNKIKEVRSPLKKNALFAGIQMHAGVAGVQQYCVDHKVLVLTAGDQGDVIRLAPPLVISQARLTEALQVLEDAIALSDAPALAEPASTQATSALLPDLAQTSFSSKQDYLQALDALPLPLGFRTGKSSFEFAPEELPSSKAHMTMTLLVPSAPVTNYACLLTSNAFPGAPIRVTKQVLEDQAPIGAIVVNNKISNVHPRGGGVADARLVCDAVKHLLDLPQGVEVLPSSTGVIGWRIPAQTMATRLPDTVSALQDESILPGMCFLV